MACCGLVNQGGSEQIVVSENFVQYYQNPDLAVPYDSWMYLRKLSLSA